MILSKYVNTQKKGKQERKAMFAKEDGGKKERKRGWRHLNDGDEQQ